MLNPVDPGKSETNRSSLRYGLSVSNQGEDKDRVAFPALSSVLDEQALLNRVVCHYDLPHPARECQFFDRGDSDIYRVRTEHAAFYLKVYRPPYAAEQVEQEAQRVHDLAQLGIPVVEPVAQKDGRFVTSIGASAGERPILLFREAPEDGAKGASDEAAESWGHAVAGLHDAMDRLDSRRPR